LGSSETSLLRDERAHGASRQTILLAAGRFLAHIGQMGAGRFQRARDILAGDGGTLQTDVKPGRDRLHLVGNALNLQMLMIPATQPTMPTAESSTVMAAASRRSNAMALTSSVRKTRPVREIAWRRQVKVARASRTGPFQLRSHLSERTFPGSGARGHLARPINP
jgi:hypothetical protein